MLLVHCPYTIHYATIFASGCGMWYIMHEKRIHLDVIYYGGSTFARLFLSVCKLQMCTHARHTHMQEQ